MLVKVKAFAGFREILGSEQVLDMEEGSTIAALLDRLASSSPAFRKRAYDSSGRLQGYVLLMINKKRIDPVQGLSMQLFDGDEIAIFPPVAGG